jgi:hypothetical protein
MLFMEAMLREWRLPVAAILMQIRLDVNPGVARRRAAAASSVDRRARRSQQAGGFVMRLLQRRMAYAYCIAA